MLLVLHRSLPSRVASLHKQKFGAFQLPLSLNGMMKCSALFILNLREKVQAWREKAESYQVEKAAVVYRHYPFSGWRCRCIRMSHCLNIFSTELELSHLVNKERVLKMGVNQIPVIFYFAYLLGDGVSSDVTPIFCVCVFLCWALPSALWHVVTWCVVRSAEPCVASGSNQTYLRSRFRSGSAVWLKWCFTSAPERQII